MWLQFILLNSYWIFPLILTILYVVVRITPWGWDDRIVDLLIEAHRKVKGLPLKLKNGNGKSNTP